MFLFVKLEKVKVLHLYHLDMEGVHIVLIVDFQKMSNDL